MARDLKERLEELSAKPTSVLVTFHNGSTVTKNLIGVGKDYLELGLPGDTPMIVPFSAVCHLRPQ